MDNLIQFLGRLHPLIVHLPIGILMMTIVFHGLAWRGRYVAFREVLPLLWFAGCISTILAALAGYLLSLSGDYEAEALNTHMYLGIGLALFSVIVFISLQRGFPVKIQIPGILGVAILLFATGHYGGNLTHGEEYLTQPLYAMIGKTPVRPVRKPIINLEEAVVYQDLVEPVLEKKCWQCHSAQKQKGGLRLDTKEYLLKGGKHGEVLTAGNAEKSNLYKSLVLPEGDDKRMPPKGKPQLDETEIQLIHWWITQGQADFNKKVAEVPKDEAISTILAGFSPGTEGAGPGSAPIAEIPEAKVAKPDAAAMQQLEKLGVAFTPLTPDHVFLAANLGNTANFTDAQMNLLSKLKDQIIWLDMSETKVTDNALAQIAQFKYLTRLSLDNTAVTDNGLGNLARLPNLHYLNLYGTKVTDKGLKSLAACKNLKALYLWQTQVTPQGVATLQQARGSGIEINYGNEFDHTNNL
jgi:uncharacterized membrane protein/mono/diheme cytochrome c family protein